MAIENARAFYLKVGADERLQQKIWELAEENPIGMKAAIIKVAAENGFHFTLEEMKTFMEDVITEFRELSDEELVSVSGGSKGSLAALSVIFANH